MKKLPITIVLLALVLGSCACAANANAYDSQANQESRDRAAQDQYFNKDDPGLDADEQAQVYEVQCRMDTYADTLSPEAKAEFGDYVVDAAQGDPGQTFEEAMDARNVPHYDECVMMGE